MTCTFFDKDEDSPEENPDDKTNFDDEIEDLSKWKRDQERQVTTERTISLLDSGRRKIQVVNDSMLRISGLLLTASLSGLFFIYTNSISWYVGLCLFIASILLSFSTFESIKALELKPNTSVLNDALLDEIKDAHDKEVRITSCAILILKLGIGALIFGLALFAIDSVHFIDVIKNSTLSNLMLVAEIPCQAKIFFHA